MAARLWNSCLDWPRSRATKHHPCNPVQTCVKQPLKNRQNKDLSDKWWFDEGWKYCRMLPCDNWSWKPILGLFESGCFTQVLLYSPSITTVCDLLPRKARIQDSAFPLIPYWWSFQMSFEWLTLSKAFEQYQISLFAYTCISCKVLEQHGKLSITWPFFSEAVLKIIQQVMLVMLVKVLYQMWCHYMFKDLAENTGEGDRSLICSQCFITFFEDGADLGSLH